MPRPEGYCPLRRREINMDTQEMIVSGMTRQQIVEALRASGMSYDQASKSYYIALKDMAPADGVLDDYRRGMIQLNLDRLERIINETIGGSFQSKAVALKSIAEINRMLGVSGGDKVTIDQRGKDGDTQTIRITFGE